MHLNDALAAYHRAGGSIPTPSNPYFHTYAPPPAIADFNFIDPDLASSPLSRQPHRPIRKLCNG
jgi:hypothetical protein